MKELDIVRYVGLGALAPTRSRSLCKRPGCDRRTNTGIFCPEHYKAIPQALRRQWRAAYLYGTTEERRDAYNTVIRYFKTRDRLTELIDNG